MSEETAGDEVELGALLALLSGAADSFRTVRATYRIWRHTQRSHDAQRAEVEERKRCGEGVSFVIARPVAGREDPPPPPPPPETHETVRIWRDGPRLREEHHGGHQDGNYGVADGPLWWSWSEQFGARCNQDDPRVESGIGQQLRFMLNPTPLLGFLSFWVSGRSEVAGRGTVTTHAILLPRVYRHAGFFNYGLLGIGAQHYKFEIDRERGVPLAVSAIRDEQPFFKITTLAICFDEPIPAETFHFVAPEGEEIQTVRDTQRLQESVSLTEAQQRAPFTVLLPERALAGWHMRCMFVKAVKRPPSPARLSLTYRSADGQQSLAIWQTAAADRAAFEHGTGINDENWQVVARDRTVVGVRTTEWGEVEVRLERDGTFAYLISNDLSADQIATMAASLRPAPSASQGD
ncbi:hypothetical protein [Mycobacterium attenuatum]|uniref:hypothetical protein n=1 Tax=Mycobacterium attenuatum TaxID=2341086 RepID=UPI000F01F668|nr:hypothetical protein [Mycobacterium attenuatum]VBA62461.1 hypothetical protein LAUMK41_05852 [Mycobacterium attenuatum]